MVYDPGDLLGVALQNGHHLLCVLVKDSSVAVITTGQ